MQNNVSWTLQIGEPFGLPLPGTAMRERGALPYLYDYARYRPKRREGRSEASCNNVATGRQFIPGGEKIPKKPPTSRESRSWWVRGAKKRHFREEKRAFGGRFSLSFRAERQRACCSAVATLPALCHPPARRRTGGAPRSRSFGTGLPYQEAWVVQVGEPSGLPPLLLTQVHQHHRRDTMHPSSSRYVAILTAVPEANRISKVDVASNPLIPDELGSR